MRRFRDALLPDALAAGGLVAAWATFFWRVFTPDASQRLQFIGRDLALQFFVIRKRAYAQFFTGQFPLIEPCIYAGYPIHADPQAQLFYLPQWLAFAVVRALGFAEYPFRALEWEVLLHALLGMLTMYVFLRAMRGGPSMGPLAAAFGALTWGFGGFMTGYVLDQFALLATAAWVPLLMLASNRLAFAANLIATTRACVCAGGAALLVFSAGNTQLFLHATLAAAMLFIAWCAMAKLAFGPALLRAAAAGFFALGLCSPALLPQLDFALASTRATSSYAALSQGFNWPDLAMLLRPAGPGWWGLHVGVAALLLAVIGIALAPRAAWPWLILVVMALLLSLGGNGPLFWLAYRFVPGYNLFRQQERHAMLFALAIAPLAAIGLQQLRARLPFPARVLALGVGAVFLLQAVDLFAAHRNNPLAVGAPAAPVPLPGHLAWLRQRDAPYDVDQTRVYNQFGLDLNWACGNGLQDVRGGSPIEPVNYVTLLQRAPESVLLRILHVRYASSWRDSYVTEQGVPISNRKLGTGMLDGQPANVFALDWQPMGDFRAWVAVRSSLHTSPDALFARMSGSDYDSLGEALLYAEDAAGLALSPSPNRSSTVIKADPSLWQVEAYADAPTVLVFSLAHSRQWRATVNGEPAPVLRANHALVAVPIPAGTSNVELHFASLPLRAGAGVGLVVLPFSVIAVMAAGLIKSHPEHEGKQARKRQ